MENKINFGELDTLVLLRSCVITYGTQGAKKYTFQVYKVKPLTTRWRVVVEGRSYEITGIDPISRVSPLCHLTLHAVD